MALLYVDCHNSPLKSITDFSNTVTVAYGICVVLTEGTCPADAVHLSNYIALKGTVCPHLLLTPRAPTA